MSEWKKIAEVIKILRGEKGCAWDKAQHFADYLKMMQEETVELVEAYERKQLEQIREELGDVVWNAIYLLYLAKEEWGILPEKVLKQVREKMIKRHPHIFGERKLSTPEEVWEYWQEAKKKEKESSL